MENIHSKYWPPVIKVRKILLKIYKIYLVISGMFNNYENYWPQIVISCLENLKISIQNTDFLSYKSGKSYSKYWRPVMMVRKILPKLLISCHHGQENSTQTIYPLSGKRGNIYLKHWPPVTKPRNIYPTYWLHITKARK